MTTDKQQTIALGQAKITILDLGTLRADLADWLRVPAAERLPRHAADFNEKIYVPVQCLHIALPGASILVDACHPEAIGTPDILPPNYQPSPGLLEQLAALGVQPEAITHVIITHTHFDHYCGLIRLQDGPDTPSFTQARHYIGRADWENAQAMLAKADSLESRALGVVNSYGLLEPVEGELDLGHGVRIIPAPGETPGHQIVRVESDGQVLYGLGDLYHHPFEVERPDWMVHWADAEANRRSKTHLAKTALAEDALLVATHIAGLGQLRPAADGIIWETVSNQ